MSPFHNRMGIVTFAVTAAVLLLGAGCQKQGYPPNIRALDQGTSTPPPADAATTPATDAGSGPPTKWIEYRSEKLGITIPYPEGWYVEENADQGRIMFYAAAPSAASDSPADMWFEREDGTIGDALSGLNIASQEPRTKNGRNMMRIEFIEDFYEPPQVLLYLWEQEGQTHQLGGPNREVVEYTVDHLGVSP